MHTVTILHVGPLAAIELKDQLVTAGLVDNQDFTWEYHQARYDNDGYTAVTPRQVIFSFREPALATFYQLKWLR